MVGETVANAAPTWYIRGMSLLWSKNSAGVTSYLYNAHGDVVKTTGAAENDYLYDAFGNQVDEVSNQPFDWRVEVAPVVVDDNPFRYCGEYFDYETGYIYLRARYYDSTNGRFVSEDPIRSGNHWYAYCGGNPIKFVDPMGLYFTPPGQDPKNPNHYTDGGTGGSGGNGGGSTTPQTPTTTTTKPPISGKVQPGIEVDRDGNPILPAIPKPKKVKPVDEPTQIPEPRDQKSDKVPKPTLDEIFARTPKNPWLVPLWVREHNMDMIRDLDSSMWEDAWQFLLDANDAGLPLIIWEGFRTRQDQEKHWNYNEWLKSQGLPSGIVAAPGTSPHEFGIAFDVRFWEPGYVDPGYDIGDPTKYPPLRKIAKNNNLKWGGNWQTPDYPHFYK